MAELYGIANIHPEMLANDAIGIIGVPNLTNKFNTLRSYGLFGAACDELANIGENMQNERNNLLRRATKRLGIKDRYWSDLEKACNLGRTAAEIIYNENRILRELGPDVVYMEDFLSQGLARGEVHRLSNAISEIGAEPIYLGFPEGFFEQAQDIARRIDSDPKITEDPEFVKETIEHIEQKDYMWAEIIGNGAISRKGKGLIVAGMHHLVGGHGYRGLTSKFLEEKGITVNILHYDNPVQLGKRLGIDLLRPSTRTIRI